MGKEVTPMYWNIGYAIFMTLSFAWKIIFLGLFFSFSSIEHGGTRPFSNIMAPLTLFNEAPKRKSIAPLALKNAYLWLHWPSLVRGYETIFQYVVFLCYYTLVLLFSLRMTMVWVLARGAGIPAPSDAIDVCVSKHQSALIGGDGDSQLHCRAAGQRT